MRIEDDEPETWEDLEIAVPRILTEVLAAACCRRTGQLDHRDRPAIVGLPGTSSRGQLD